MSKEFFYALALSLLATIMTVFQMIYPTIPPQVGYPIVGVLGIGAIGCIYKVIRGKEHQKEAYPTALSTSRKDEAIKIHDGFIQREKEFWQELEKIPETESALDDSAVKNAMFNMQVETNKLATVIGRADFDEFIENLLNLYNRYAMFHFRSGNHSVEIMRNRINRKIRLYIRKIKN